MVLKHKNINDWTYAQTRVKAIVSPFIENNVSYFIASSMTFIRKYNQQSQLFTDPLALLL